MPQILLLVLSSLSKSMSVYLGQTGYILVVQISHAQALRTGGQNLGFWANLDALNPRFFLLPLFFCLSSDFAQLLLSLGTKTAGNYL